MTKVITKMRALDLLGAAIQDRHADYVDPNSKHGWGCVNVTKDEDTKELSPSCIVGHALSIEGVPLEFLYLHNGSSSSVINDWRNRERTEGEEDIEITPGAAVVFRAAQFVQDRGGTWGDALKNAEAIYWALDTQDID